MIKKTYQVNIAGLKRKLPLFQVAPDLKIALFNILGDTEVVLHAAKALAKKIPKEVDVLVTPEVKSVPLAFELSMLLNKPYIVTRKIRKPYMTGSIKADVTSITTGKLQTLWLDGRDIKKVAQKKVALVDDVISTGSTLKGLRDLMKKAKAKIVAEVAVFTEGDKDQWKDVISLGHLPLFKK
ncbi:MAG: phosphoribosyltransferase family protein [Candidatus Woesebacteria bacterium]|jgi:adenine phosphoribosyltransferase